jgi:DNA-binding HxlR family transcriptional regulator
MTGVRGDRGRPQAPSLGGARADGPIGAADPPPVTVHRAPTIPLGATSLPTDELRQLFERFRAQSAEFRDEVLANTGGSFALPPGDQAKENLKVVRSIFGKWSIDILTVLTTQRSARFSDLRRTLPRISSDVLSRKLYALEAAGLVERRVLGDRPPAVEYALTEDGLTLTRLGEPILMFLRLVLASRGRR